MTTLLAVRGLRDKTDASFRRALVAMAQRLSVDPNFITPVMANESGFNPQARNPMSNATGLIQFMPSTAVRLGTTVDAIYKLSAEDQLPLVEKYYTPYASKINTPGDSYMAVFMPKYIGSNPSTVIATKPDKVYTQNNVFDRTKKGYITVGDVELSAESTYAQALRLPPIVDDDGISTPPPPNHAPPPIELATAGASGSPRALWFLASGLAAYWTAGWLLRTKSSPVRRHGLGRQGF